MKKAWAIARMNYQNQFAAWLVTDIAILSVSLNEVIGLLIPGLRDGASQVSVGCYAYLFLLLIAILIPALNFRRFMNLNANKQDYIKGCALTYLTAALAVSAFNLVFYYTWDVFFRNLPRQEVWNTLDIFGWMQNGPALAFLQQCAFLLLVAAAVHTFTTIQTFWYGWVTALVIGAILGVFIPIQPLRRALLFVFHMLIFHPNPLVQILCCLGASALIYLLSIPAVRQKHI